MDSPRLHFDRLAADGATPSRALLVLHGIFGAGRNWGSVARRFVEAKPAWAALTVDLRQHGASQGFPPPHTLEAAAGDLRALAEGLEPSAAGVLGHSFGGKVALVWTRAAPAALGHVWVVDSTPDAREPSGSAWDMLQVLKGLPGPFGSRDDAVQGLVEAGVAGPVAMWMATNLERDGDALRWRIDAGEMEALLRDFFRTDAWDVVEAPPEGVTLHFVKAERSSVLDEEAAARVEEAGRRSGRVHLHRVRGGHWLNADNPDAVVALLVREM